MQGASKLPVPSVPSCPDRQRDVRDALVTQKGRFPFAPQIEIWDIDVIDALEPLAVLGAEGNHPVVIT